MMSTPGQVQQLLALGQMHATIAAFADRKNAEAGCARQRCGRCADRMHRQGLELVEFLAAVADGIGAGQDDGVEPGRVGRRPVDLDDGEQGRQPNFEAQGFRFGGTPAGARLGP